MNTDAQHLTEDERTALLALLKRADPETRQTLAREMLNELLSGN